MTDTADTLSKAGAHSLAARLDQFWREQGATTVKHTVHAAGVDRTSKGDPEDNSRAVYVVRSNLVRGNPPKAPKR